jgi:hypothetical protein
MEGQGYGLVASVGLALQFVAGERQIEMILAGLKSDAIAINGSVGKFQYLLLLSRTAATGELGSILFQDDEEGSGEETTGPLAGDVRGVSGQTEGQSDEQSSHERITSKCYYAIGAKGIVRLTHITRECQIG